MRRTGWLTVLGAAAAGTYVAARARGSPRPPVSDARRRLRVADLERTTPDPTSRAEHEPAAGEAASGVVTMVPVTMEASVARVPESERNGSANGSMPEATSPPVPVAGPVELPPRSRPSPGTLAGLSALAGVAAVALGSLALASALEAKGADADALGVDAQRAIGLLSKPSTERIPLEGSGRRVVLAVGSGLRGVLVLERLEPAPSGKAYEAWVLGPKGDTPLPAAVFSGSERVVPLSRPVPPGARVAVTVESALGADAPTQPLRLVARRAG